MRRPAALLCLLLLALGGCSGVAFAAETTTTNSLVSTTTASSSPTTSTTTAPTTTSVPAPTSTTPIAHAERRAVAAPHAAGDAVVTVKSGTGACLFCFSPADVTIPAGGSVTFTNKSGADHTVARCTPAACDGVSGGTGTDAAFANATVALPDGASFHVTISQPGTYVYYCTIHGYAVMHGTITVAAAATTTTAAASGPAPPTTSPPPVQAVSPLASTGASSEPLALVGIVVLLAGGAAAAIGSRRR